MGMAGGFPARACGRQGLVPGCTTVKGLLSSQFLSTSPLCLHLQTNRSTEDSMLPVQVLLPMSVENRTKTRLFWCQTNLAIHAHVFFKKGSRNICTRKNKNSAWISVFAPKVQPSFPAHFSKVSLPHQRTFHKRCSAESCWSGKLVDHSLLHLSSLGRRSWWLAGHSPAPPGTCACAKCRTGLGTQVRLPYGTHAWCGRPCLHVAPAGHAGGG